MKHKRLIIIGGISGSGKSTVLNAFEDMGFYCVDNLPVSLLASFADLIINLQDQENTGVFPGRAVLQQGEVALFALLINFRDQHSFASVAKVVASLREAGVEVSLLFLDCYDEVVIRRYSETRRPHPLLLGVRDSDTMQEALARERQLSADFREAADRIIDTTSYTPHELRRVVEDYCRHQNELGITLVSFGYKYGVPPDADLLVDVRFLANPYFVNDLRSLSGLDQPVYDYIFQHSDAEEFVKKYLSLLEYLLPRYQQEGKRYLTIGIGCTGGRHRAIAVAERLSKELQGRGVSIALRHRDINRS